ncbi:helix-hairpin-helix domain-containing protein [Micromonospora sp. CPCC 205561]|uniref:helix-hairpin-helix domain-containing protein n=1 Tax=Micromonospora sp. CPCC 205561 TaxID=3122407 RepID=UPI002FF39D09
MAWSFGHWLILIVALVVGLAGGWFWRGRQDAAVAAHGAPVTEGDPVAPMTAVVVDPPPVATADETRPEVVVDPVPDAVADRDPAPRADTPADTDAATTGVTFVAADQRRGDEVDPADMALTGDPVPAPDTGPEPASAPLGAADRSDAELVLPVAAEVTGPVDRRPEPATPAEPASLSTEPEAAPVPTTTVPAAVPVPATAPEPAPVPAASARSGPATAAATPGEPDPTEPAPAEPVTAATGPRPVPVEPEPVSIQAEPGSAEPEPDVAEPVVVSAEPEPVSVEPQPVSTQAEPGSAEPEPDAAEPVVVPAPRAAAEAAVAAGTGSDAADDFRRIQGVGPKMAAALQAAGIRTYRQLAELDEAALRETIRAAGLRAAPSLATWPQQAKVLAGAPLEAAAALPAGGTDA